MDSKNLCRQILRCTILSINEGQFTVKWKIRIFSLSCSASYQWRLVWCALQSLEDVNHRDVRSTSVSRLYPSLW